MLDNTLIYIHTCLVLHSLQSQCGLLSFRPSCLFHELHEWSPVSCGHANGTDATSSENSHRRGDGDHGMVSSRIETNRVHWILRTFVVEHRACLGHAQQVQLLHSLYQHKAIVQRSRGLEWFLKMLCTTISEAGMGGRSKRWVIVVLVGTSGFYVLSLLDKLFVGKTTIVPR